jgi:hypothetical protein
MDQRLLRILGGETKFYPYGLESKYPRILEKIMMLWDNPGINDYFTQLMVSDREDRAGFPSDVAAEIMRLSLVHASSHLNNQKHDVWDISTDKFASFKPSVSIDNANEWKALPVAKARSVENLGIPSTARGFHRAAEIGNRAAIAIFLESNVNTEIHDERGWSPLMLAAFNGHNEIINLLIKHHVNMLARDLLGNTALHWAADAGKISSAKLLIEHGAEVDAFNNAGLTPLFRAVMRRHLGVVLQLIDSGTNLDLTTRDGSTALHKAAAEGYTEIVRTLLHHGANTKIKNSDGNLPLTLALKNDHKDAVRLLTSKSNMQ